MKPRSFWSTFFLYFFVILVLTPPMLLLVVGGPFVLFGGSLSRLALLLRDWFTGSDFLFVCGIPALVLWSLLFALPVAALNKAASRTFKYENREAFRSLLAAELERAGYHLKGEEPSQGLVFRGRGLSPKLVAQLGPDSAEIVGPHYLVSRLSKLDRTAYTRGEALPLEESPVSQEQEAPLAKLPELTQEEKEVLSLLAEGVHNLEIASRLGISAVQASLTTSELLRKFGVDSKAELVSQATQKGYLPPS